MSKQTKAERLAEEYAYQPGSNGINDAGEPPSFSTKEYDAFKEGFEIGQKSELEKSLKLCEAFKKLTDEAIYCFERAKSIDSVYIEEALLAQAAFNQEGE